jgi:hypothetical protein
MRRIDAAAENNGWRGDRSECAIGKVGFWSRYIPKVDSKLYQAGLGKLLDICGRSCIIAEE